MDDAELDSRLRAARAIAGEALRVAVQDALRDAGVLEPVRLDVDGDRQEVVCRSTRLGAMELGSARQAPSPVLGPIGRVAGERIAGLVASVLRGDES